MFRRSAPFSIYFITLLPPVKIEVQVSALSVFLHLLHSISTVVVIRIDPRSPFAGMTRRKMAPSKPLAERKRNKQLLPLY